MLDALVVSALADFPRRKRQHLHRPRDALGEVEPHPGRADQDQQRHHHKEREIDAGERLPQHAELRVVLVGFRHPARAGRQVPRQVVAGDDDPDQLTRGVSDHAGGADQIATAAHLFEHARLAVHARRDARGQTIDRRPRPSLRHARRRHIDQRQHIHFSSGQRHRAIHLEDTHAPLVHIACELLADGAQIRRAEIDGRQQTGEPVGLVGDRLLAIAVIVRRQLIRQREHFLNRLTEPLIDRAQHDVGADDEHQHGRNQRHPEQHEHQLRAEPNERNGPPPLDEQLDDVARQHEGQGEQHHHVGRRQGVENDLGEEVRRQARRAIGEDENAREDRDEDEDAREDQARAVPERPAHGARAGIGDWCGRRGGGEAHISN